MNDPKDPFHITRKKVFLWGAATTAILCALIYLFIPPPPQDDLLTQPLQGPGSERGAVDATGTEASGGTGGSGEPSPVTPNASGSAVGLVPQQSDDSPKGNYIRYCAQCHGEDGRAKTQMARMMTVKPPNLVQGPFRFARTQEAVQALIANGTGVMPGFGKELGEEKARLLADYVLAMANSSQSDGGGEKEE